jgi:NADH:ubiquinone oxidoreductase subunit B-like Fe-S oxidoreductase
MPTCCARSAAGWLARTDIAEYVQRIAGPKNRPADLQMEGAMQMGLEDHLPAGFLLTTVEQWARYARSRSMWPATFGLACCAYEVLKTSGPRHDMARFGMEKTGATPRQADLMIVAGRVS